MQCLHQHTPLSEVLLNLAQGKSHTVKDYLHYKQHNCRQVYADVAAWESRRASVEEAWPEYVTCVDMLSKRGYLASIDLDSRVWLSAYLEDHVQRIQELKNHHVHPFNDKGDRVPLTHCRRADDPSKCKGDFPRTKWLIEQSVVLCPRFLNGCPPGLPSFHVSVDLPANVLFVLQVILHDV